MWKYNKIDMRCLDRVPTFVKGCEGKFLHDISRISMTFLSISPWHFCATLVTNMWQDIIPWMDRLIFRLKCLCRNAYGPPLCWINLMDRNAFKGLIFFNIIRGVRFVFVFCWNKFRWFRGRGVKSILEKDWHRWFPCFFKTFMFIVCEQWNIIFFNEGTFFHEQKVDYFHMCLLNYTTYIQRSIFWPERNSKTGKK